MKLKFIICKGLSGCGKSTWAAKFAQENPNTLIVTKDDIRCAIGARYGVNEKRVKESKVIEKRNQLIIEGLEKGLNIVSADTNLNHLHIKNMKSLVFPKYRETYDVEIKDFTDVPVEVCIERCKNRPENREDPHFWEKVIMKQKNQFIVPKKLYEDADYWYNPKLPKCIIMDMDGNLAIHQGRSPFDFAKCTEDLPNAPLLDITKMYCANPDITVIVLSGRPDDFRTETENWLKSYGVDYDHLYMRKSGDMRKDVIVKKEIYEAEIEGKYSVYAVHDDRRQVVEGLWTQLGLPVFAFGNPYEDF